MPRHDRHPLRLNLGPEQLGGREQLPLLADLGVAEAGLVGAGNEAHHGGEVERVLAAAGTIHK